jgi:hypothetical protein
VRVLFSQACWPGWPGLPITRMQTLDTGNFSRCKGLSKVARVAGHFRWHMRACAHTWICHIYLYTLDTLDNALLLLAFLLSKVHAAAMLTLATLARRARP